MTEATNPLLENQFRIPFDRIRAEHVVPGLRHILAEAREGIEAIAGNDAPPSWSNTIKALDDLLEGVRTVSAPVQHLLSVAESPELRAAWGEILPEISAFWSELFLHEGLWARLKSFAGTPEAAALKGLSARHLEKVLRDFRRSGADLSPEKRQRLAEIDLELATLEQRFSENVLDATAAFSLHIADEEQLRGIPGDAVERFRLRAEQQGTEGWILTLDHPSYEAVVKYAEDRILRKEINDAFLALGAREPFDNRPLIPQILRLRGERAGILGYRDYPDYRLEEQMVGSGGKARSFLNEVVEKTRPYWSRDGQELVAYAESLEIAPFEPFDTAFVMEKLRRERFDLDDEELRPYFTVETVLQGVFEVARILFGFRIEEEKISEVWHPDVRYFRLLDAEGKHLGSFYADLFTRPEKRQGAWMNDFIHGEPAGDGSLTPHLGLICANFAPPTEGRPALLNHREVETLFHEFGHLIHHLASRVSIPSHGGINVAWDWVELPSQLLENWAWEKESLDLFARHWETGQRLPDELFERMSRARRFMGGWRQMRQLAFGTLDLALHTEYDPKGGEDPVSWVTRLIEPLSLNPRFAAAHPLAAFSHIFSGGYAASYYSYMWSEVLEADLFTRFLERGIFDRDTGHHYLESILSRGDSDDPDILYRDFMGRDPDPEALIRRNLGAL